MLLYIYENIQQFMPPVYFLLAASLAYAVAISLFVPSENIFQIKSKRLSNRLLGVYLLLNCLAISILTLSTGDNPLVSLSQFRVYIVFIRLCMFVVITAYNVSITLYALPNTNRSIKNLFR